MIKRFLGGHGQKWVQPVWSRDSKIDSISKNEHDSVHANTNSGKLLNADGDFWLGWCPTLGLLNAGCPLHLYFLFPQVFLSVSQQQALMILFKCISSFRCGVETRVLLFLTCFLVIFVACSRMSVLLWVNWVKYHWLNPFSTNPTKCSNTLRQKVRMRVNLLS